MLINTANEAQDLSSTRVFVSRAGKLATRKIWLPRLVYDALPYFYLSSGFAALFATLYISDWFWVLPHYLLFSAACLHLSLVVLRRRKQQSQESSDSTAADDTPQ
ncbi:hypothetical protein [Woeseia oceani]|uniref:Uncharacterized protein n=1 Tax=Woeseia oceani TaxID=1548547 RepID=A0A193LGR0_9GAMM|nr:hypothetical protein [Woeseia oceani]ANO51549.1 hypothetical protein BA177_10335 [Woeseia oceani]